jgi:hypothetical protein
MGNWEWGMGEASFHPVVVCDSTRGSKLKIGLKVSRLKVKDFPDFVVSFRLMVPKLKVGTGN